MSRFTYSGWNMRKLRTSGRLVSREPWYQLTFVSNRAGTLNEDGSALALHLYSCNEIVPEEGPQRESLWTGLVEYYRELTGVAPTPGAA